MNNNFSNTNRDLPPRYYTQSQITMGIDAKKASLWDRINSFVSNTEKKLEVMPFWKNYSFVFALISTIAFPTTVVAIMILKFNVIPLEILSFYNPQTSSWELANKAVVILLPIFYGILNLILLNLTYTIFQFDRRLAQIISITMNIANVLFIIAFAQILSITIL